MYPTLVEPTIRIIMTEQLNKCNKIHPILNEILDLIHLHRPCVNPNMNFILQLKIWEKNNI